MTHSMSYDQCENPLKLARELGAVDEAQIFAQRSGGSYWISTHYFNAKGLEVLYRGPIGVTVYGPPRAWSKEHFNSLTLVKI